LPGEAFPSPSNVLKRLILPIRAGGFFGGPTVTIYVGPEGAKLKYTLAKNLPCSVSEFFKAAFEGKFKEGEDQVLHLSEDSPERLRAPHSGNVRLPPTKKNSGVKVDKKILLQDNISRYLGFLMFCNKLLLPETCGGVISHMRTCLSENRNALLPTHIRTAIQLPSCHLARRLFAEAAVVGYMDAQAMSQGKNFWLHKEVEEPNEFAADLLIACGEIWGSCKINAKGYLTWKDPPTMRSCSVHAAAYSELRLGPSLA
jgi:hypothetical protein